MDRPAVAETAGRARAAQRAWWSLDFYAPFGAEKESSHGPREQGIAAVEFHTSVRAITLAPHDG